MIESAKAALSGLQDGQYLNGHSPKSKTYICAIELISGESFIIVLKGKSIDHALQPLGKLFNSKVVVRCYGDITAMEKSLTMFFSKYTETAVHYHEIEDNEPKRVNGIVSQVVNQLEASLPTTLAEPRVKRKYTKRKLNSHSVMSEKPESKLTIVNTHPTDFEGEKSMKLVENFENRKQIESIITDHPKPVKKIGKYVVDEKGKKHLMVYDGKPTKFMRELEAGTPKNKIVMDANGKRHFTLRKGKPTKYALQLNGIPLPSPVKPTAKTNKTYIPATDQLGDKRKRPFKLRGPRGPYKSRKTNKAPVKVTLVTQPATKETPEKVTALVAPEDLKRIGRTGIARVIEKVFGR